MKRHYSARGTDSFSSPLSFSFLNAGVDVLICTFVCLPGSPSPRSQSQVPARPGITFPSSANRWMLLGLESSPELAFYSIGLRLMRMRMCMEERKAESRKFFLAGRGIITQNNWYSENRNSRKQEQIHSWILCPGNIQNGCLIFFLFCNFILE